MEYLVCRRVVRGEPYTQQRRSAAEWIRENGGGVVVVLLLGVCFATMMLYSIP